MTSIALRGMMDKLTDASVGAIEQMSGSKLKQIPLSVLIVLLLQTGGAIWWGASITSDLRNLNNNVVYRMDAEERDRKREVEELRALLRDTQGDVRVSGERAHQIELKLARAGIK